MSLAREVAIDLSFREGSDVVPEPEPEPAAPPGPLPPVATPNFPPTWAVEWGHDEYGPYASFAVQRIIQRMRWCPPGRFLMGRSPEEAPSGTVEAGRTEVSLAHGFWMADTPVTLALFCEVMGAHPSAASPGDPSRPVTSLLRQDAVDFAVQVDTLLAAHEPSPGRLVVRLPTEAEWEYACRAGTKTLHYLGSGQLELDKIAWHMGNACGEVQPVARLLPNAWGLFDMLGNVWEWCLDDSVGRDFIGRPDKPAKFPNSLGWARGGGCSFLPQVVSAAVRWEVTPAPQERELGLRLCIGPAFPSATQSARLSASAPAPKPARVVSVGEQSVQTDMLRFHRNIKLDNYDENQTLREKRDIVLQRLRDRGLSFAFFNQGSYAMGTGVLPIDGDFDIDVGLIIKLPAGSSVTPTQLMRLVFDGAQWPNQQVEWRRNCIRVQWIRRGEPAYHVDLACYLETSRGLLRAVGREHSRADLVDWDACDPTALVAVLSNLPTPEANAQRRRVIRTLKRWKDVNFQPTGNARPAGVAITALVLSHFQPLPHASATEGQMDDLGALSDVVDRLLSPIQYNGARRLRAILPVPPGNDILEKQTDEQQRQLIAKLQQLQAALRNARRGDTRALAMQLGSALG